MSKNDLHTIIATYGGLDRIWITFHRNGLNKRIGCNGYRPSESSQKRYLKAVEGLKITTIHLYEDTCSIQYWMDRQS